MRRNRKKNLKLLSLILLLLLGIGFAALTANLKIDGTLNVSRTAWDVHFENVSITQGSVTANPAPTSDDTTTTEMTYTINFTKPGDFFEFTTDIVNDGTIDAMVDVVSNNAYATAASTTPITLPTYLKSTVIYDDGTAIEQNQKLDHNTSEKIKVRVEFRTDISASDLPSSGDTSIVFKFIGNYKQADEKAMAIRCPSSDCVYAFPLFRYETTIADRIGTINYIDPWWAFKDGEHPLTVDILTARYLTTESHQQTTLQDTDYETNYENIMQETGKNYFIGMILDKNKKIDRTFICYNNGIKITCVEAKINDQIDPSTDGETWETQLIPTYSENINEMYFTKSNSGAIYIQETVEKCGYETPCTGIYENYSYYQAGTTCSIAWCGILGCYNYENKR